MTPAEIAVTVVAGLIVNEFCEISPWAARMLVKWSARYRYAGDPDRVEVRASELAALIDARPGKLFKLLTACGFVVAALSFHLTALMRRMARAHDDRAAPAAPEAAASDAALIMQRAAQGDQQAWERLVEQYAGLVWAITRHFKLSPSDAADVSQTTWLRLLEHIDRIRRPTAVSAWLVTTARRECELKRRSHEKLSPVQDDEDVFESAFEPGPETEDVFLANERAAALHQAISRLPGRGAQLMEMLMADPPATYAEISDRLGIPMGSIGPIRGRCLKILREELAGLDDNERDSGDALLIARRPTN